MLRRKNLGYKMKQVFFMKAVLLVAVLWIVTFASGGDMQTQAPKLRLTVIFNNVSLDKRLSTSWGFGFLIEGRDGKII